MRCKIYLLLTVILSVGSSLAIAQQSIELVDTEISSPEAAAMARYGSLEVSMFKGVPEISIPVYNIQLKDFSLPIALNYDNSGVKVEQIATAVGLGWNLQAGGQISAMSYSRSDVLYPMDLPEDYENFDPNNFDGSGAWPDDYEYAQSMFDPFGPVQRNTKPDVFYYNFGGQNGRFLIDTTMNADFNGYPVPYKDIIIKNPDNVGGLAFEIIDQQGHRYIFAELETTEIQKDFNRCGGGPGGGSSHQVSPLTALPEQSYSWKLSRVITTNNDTLEFVYDTQQTNFTYDATRVEQIYDRQTAVAGCDILSDYSCVYEKTLKNTRFLKEIKHSRSDLQVLFSYGDAREDFGNSEFKRLSSIEIKKHGNSIKKMGLSQGYFESPGTGAGILYKRLKLTQVQQDGLPAYEFDYDESDDIPNRNSYAQDIWGYYNGETSNSTLVPNGAGLTGAADRSVDTSKVGFWSMESITYPTGGKTIFNMEADTEGGGLRVRSIRDEDGMGTTTNERFYEYTRHDYGSLSFLGEYNEYLDGDTNGDPSCRYNMYTSSSAQPVNVVDGPDFGYPEVDVFYGDENGGDGKSEYTYTLGSTSGSLAWGRGELESVKHYKNDSGFKLVKETENVYKYYRSTTGFYEPPERAHEHYFYALDIKLNIPEKTECGGGFCYIPAKFEVNKHRLISAWFHLDTTYVRTYDPDNVASFMSTFRVQQFDTVSTKLAQTIEANSDETTRTTQFTYAEDEVSGFSGKRRALYSLEILDDADETLSKRWQTWSDTLGSGRWEIDTIEEWNGTGSSAPTDPDANTITIQDFTEYDNYGNILRMENGNGHLTKFWYGSNSAPFQNNGAKVNGVPGVYLTGIQNVIGDDDCSNNCGTRPGSSDNLFINAEYDTKGRLTDMVDENEEATSYTYDNLNRLTEIENPDNDQVNRFSYHYTAPLSASDPNRIEQATYFSASDSVTDVTYFDGLGRQIQSQTRAGDGTAVVTGMLYNIQGRPAVSSRPIELDVDAYANGYVDDLWGSGFDPNTPGDALGTGGQIYQYYDSGFSGATDARYAYTQTEFQSNPLGRPQAEGNAASVLRIGQNDTRFSYGLNDSGEQFEGFTTEELFKTTIEDPVSDITHSFTDGWGNTIATVTEMSGSDLTTTFEYDELGRLETTTAPEGSVTSYSYDKRGNLVLSSLADQDEDNAYRYGKNGQLRFHRDPNRAASDNEYYYTTYDDLNRPAEQGRNNSSANFDNTTYIYDLDWPTSGNDPYVRYTYDEATYTGSVSGFSVENAKGRIAKVEAKDLNTGNWNVTWYSYNSLGLVSEMVQDLDGLGEKHIAYSYDRAGRVTQVDYQAGETDDFYLRYSYDKLGRLAEVESSTNSVQWTDDAAYSYVADGQPGLLELAASSEDVDYQYGSQGWLSALNNPGTLGSDAFGMELEYNNDGNIGSSEWNQSANAGLITFAYDYDKAKRLMEAENTGNNYWTSTYTYDSNGNFSQLNREDNSGFQNNDGYLTFDYVNGTNRIEDISNANQQTFLFDYDDNGNMTRNDMNGISTGDYDWRNLPYSLTANSSTVTYAYDADGNRVSKTESSTTTYYVRGVDGTTLAVYEGSSLEQHNITAGEQLIGYRAQTGNRYYYLKDQVGSVRATVDENGNTAGYFDYYPFGKLMPSRYSGSERYQFTGHERDANAGMSLSYAGARYLDSEIGRWLSLDPLANEFPNISPFAYGNNNPLRYTDPTGMAPMDWVKDLETDEYIWDSSVNSAEDTPEGFAYVGESLDDVADDFEASTPGYDFWSKPNLNTNGWPGEIRTTQEGFWSGRENNIGYSLLNAPWVTIQTLNPADNQVTHLSGNLTTHNERLEAGAYSAPIGYFAGKAMQFARSGREISIGKNFRLAPFGNRTGHPTGKFPHYHRRGITDSKGNPLPGEGMGRHRPWDSPVNGRPWYTKF